MVFFSKFGKTVKDLFKTDKYELNRTVSVKCTSGSTEWTTECGFPVTEEGENSAKLVYKQKDKNFGNVEIEVPSGKPKKLDYQTPNLMEGLKVNLVVEQKEEDNAPKTGKCGVDCCGANVSLKAEYEKGQLAGKLCAVVGEKNCIHAEVATELKGFWVGGEAKFFLGGGAEYGTGVHYQLGDTQFDVKTDFEKFNIKLHKEYSSSGEVAAQYDLNLRSMKTAVSLGGKWTLDDKATAQGFLRSDLNTYLLYKHKLSSRLTASVGTSFNISNLQQENVNVHYKVEMEV